MAQSIPCNVFDIFHIEKDKYCSESMSSELVDCHLIACDSDRLTVMITPIYTSICLFLLCIELTNVVDFYDITCASQGC